MKTSFFALTLTFALSSVGIRAEAVSRPTQYVVLAFDGSKDIGMWEESRKFASEEKIGFTYFVSGVYWLASNRSGEYKHPDTGAPKSCIGYGKDSNDILRRVEQVNLAYEEKNEIASHANGHCKGASAWDQSKWSSEFAQFNHFLFDAFQINGIEGAYKFGVKSIVGFRAPFLERSKAMWDTLAEFNYRYDTSLSTHPNYWPQKIKKTWNFPLGEIKIADSSKKTLSMDYNFYVSDSGGKPDPSRADRYYERMLQSYIAYFQGNYYGNRAPLHIGHHFSKWNDGAYWRAMKSLARTVCSLPEVKCVTYTELADFMDSLSPESITAYQKGNFPKLARPASSGHNLFARAAVPNPTFWDLHLKLSERDAGVHVEVTGRNANLSGSLSIEVDGIKIAEQSRFVANALLAPLVKKAGSEISVVFKDRDGFEIQRSTRAIYRDVSPDGVFLGDAELEDRVLKGDLEEAHHED